VKSKNIIYIILFLTNKVIKPIVKARKGKMYTLDKEITLDLPTRVNLWEIINRIHGCSRNQC
jgi:hypothetical protein